jgi:hypothetical protein
MCPASASAFPGLKKLAKKYEPDDFRLKFVLFPLPYHQYAFTAAEATFTITAALGEDTFPEWLEVMYDKQEQYVRVPCMNGLPLWSSWRRYCCGIRFWNKPTQDLSTVEVTEKFYELAKATFPKLTREQWEKGMTGYGGTDADSRSRESWKYTCSRSVSGTPMYTLNGVPFDAADSEWTADDWQKIIDPMVEANRKTADDQEAVERK